MITVNEIKNGMTIKYNGHLYLVLDFQHVKPGKGSAFLRTKLRNLDTGSIQDITFSNTAEKIEKVFIEKKDMQYLYSMEDTFYFMDMDTYDQIEVTRKAVGDCTKWLVENMMAQIISHEGRILAINVAEKVALKVAHTEPGVKGNTISGGDKVAVLETGAEVRVPLFIEIDERIIVNTTTGDYVSREK